MKKYCVRFNVTNNSNGGVLDIKYCLFYYTHVPEHNVFNIQQQCHALVEIVTDPLQSGNTYV